MGIGSVIGGIGSIVGGVLGSNAQSDAAAAAAQQQAAALKQAQEQLAHYYGEAKENLNPYMTAGTNALGQLQTLLGIGPNAQAGGAGIQQALVNTPGYQFTLGQGLKAAQNNLTAQGLGGSGQAVAGATNYAQGLAGNTYQMIEQMLAGLSGSGQGAATALGQMGTQTGSNSAGLYNTLGNDQAASTIAQGNIQANMYSNIANTLGGAYSAYNGANLLGNLYGGGGGGMGGLGSTNPLSGIVNSIAGF